MNALYITATVILLVLAFAFVVMALCSATIEEADKRAMEE